MLSNSLRPSDPYMSHQNNHHWFRYWLVAWLATSHYLTHYWNIANRTLGNKLQWNLKWNLHIFIQENQFKNVVCNMASISSRPQCVDWELLSWGNVNPASPFTGGMLTKQTMKYCGISTVKKWASSPVYFPERRAMPVCQIMQSKHSYWFLLCKQWETLSAGVLLKSIGYN